MTWVRNKDGSYLSPTGRFVVSKVHERRWLLGDQTQPDQGTEPFRTLQAAKVTAERQERDS